jgi:YARHG domain
LCTAARRGVTIDATNWENDSRKLDLSVSYLPTPDNPDVPEPWRCTYDVVSKQVQPAPDQPAPGTSLADVYGENSSNDQVGAAAEQTSDGPAASQIADDVENTEADVADDDAYPGERFPATRLDELTVPDVNESSLDDITYAINEMFARHGADFKDKKVAQEFSQFDWYNSRPGVSLTEVKDEFSDLEKENLKVLERCRDAKTAASRRTSRPVRGQRAEEESTAEKIMRGIKTWQDFGAPMPPHP